MATFKQHVVSRREIFLVYSVCAFPIYSWSILQFLERAPGWLFYLSLWDVAGILAYALGAALFESALLTLGLVLAALVLPRSLLRERFVPTATLIVILLTVAGLTFHLWLDQLLGLPRALLLVTLGLYAVLAVVGYLIIHRKDAASHTLREFAERVSILAFLYIPISVVALFVIIIRNL